MKERRIAPAEASIAAAMVISVAGLGGISVHDTFVNSDADRMFPTPQAEKIAEAKKIEVAYEAYVHDKVRGRIEDPTIGDVPEYVRQAGLTLDREAERVAQRGNYIGERHAVRRLDNLSLDPGSISYKASLGGLIAIFVSAPFLPVRWRRALTGTG